MIFISNMNIFTSSSMLSTKRVPNLDMKLSLPLFRFGCGFGVVLVDGE